MLRYHSCAERPTLCDRVDPRSRPPGGARHSYACSMVGEPPDVLRREDGRRLFGLDPSIYEAGRPQYPGRALCGTRSAMRLSALARGCSRSDREPGWSRASSSLTASRSSPSNPTRTWPHSSETALEDAGHDLRVIEAAFEEAERRRRTVRSCRRRHELPLGRPGSRACQAGRAIRPGGSVALWWTLFQDPTALDDSVRRPRGSSVRGGCSHSRRRIGRRSSSTSNAACGELADGAASRTSRRDHQDADPPRRRPGPCALRLGGDRAAAGAPATARPCSTGSSRSCVTRFGGTDRTGVRDGALHRPSTDTTGLTHGGPSDTSRRQPRADRGLLGGPVPPGPHRGRVPLHAGRGVHRHHHARR